jgi:hypothetical protein
VLLTAAGYGRRVGLRLPSGEIADVRRWLPYWWTDADVEPERTWEMASIREAEDVIGDLELWVAERAAGKVFVHSAVVAFDGRALLLPGRTTCGKTTLTAALLRAGAAYGSDEWAVLTPDGLVHPYPQPLHVRTPSEFFSLIPAAELGAAPFTGPLPVGAIAHLRYMPESLYRVEPISAGVAAVRLFDNTLCARSRGPEAFDALTAATNGILAVEGTRGEASAAVPALRALITG